MNAESKVVSRELAERMQALGWKAETEQAWVLKDGTWIVLSASCVAVVFDEYCTILAPDLSEIWERLPGKIRVEGGIYHLYLNKTDDKTGARYETVVNFVLYQKTRPAEAAGLLWCWLVEKGYVKA